MERLNDYVGVEAATRAASRTVRSIQEKPIVLLIQAMISIAILKDVNESCRGTW